jgi:transmembrane sensor
MSDKQKREVQKIKNEHWSALTRVVELFRRYYSGEASQREQNSIETWAPMENEEELINDKNLEKDCDTVSVWNAVSHELKLDRQPRFSIQKHFSIGKLQRRYAAAAVIFILLGGSILYYTQHDYIQEKSGMVAQRTLFQTTDDQTISLILPDGSHIQMNRGTKFSYATRAFNRKQREVWLSGEAFFEVAKNPEKPFIIHTGTMTTTVRGTSFNVKAYPQLAENVVSVRTGKVEVTRGEEHLALLTANKQLKYSTIKHTSETTDLNWEDAAGWTEGNLVLNGAGAEELKMRLQQQFGVTITITNNALNGKSLSGSFRKERTLNEVMNTISTVYNIQYKIKDNQVTITP